MRPESLSQAVRALDGSVLVVEEDLCLNLRGRSEWCAACAEACPHEALTLCLDAVELQAERCTGCGACVPVCPAGALRLTGFSPQRFIETVAGQDTVHLHCRESRGRGGGVVIPCHAVLDARLLAAAAAEGVARVVLHGLGACGECERGDAGGGVARLGRKLADWLGDDAPVLEEGSARPEGGEGDRVRADQVRLSRRAFLRFAGARAAGGALAAAPAVWALAAEEDGGGAEDEEPPPFFQGAVDRQREAPYQAVIASRVTRLAWRDEAEDLPWRGRRIEACCSACMSCGARCPTGALRAEETAEARRITFDAALCTDCALCERICPAKSIHPEPVDPGAVSGGRKVLMERGLRRCASCESPYLPDAGNDSGHCPVCRNERALDEEWMSWLGG